MKKFRRILAVLGLCAVPISFLASCNNSNKDIASETQSSQVYVTIITVADDEITGKGVFLCNVGNTLPIQSQSMEGYTYKGLYYDKDFVVKVPDNFTVREETTLYAKFVKELDTKAGI